MYTLTVNQENTSTLSNLQTRQTQFANICARKVLIKMQTHCPKFSYSLVQIVQTNNMLSPIYRQHIQRSRVFSHFSRIRLSVLCDKMLMKFISPLVASTSCWMARSVFVKHLMQIAFRQQCFTVIIIEIRTTFASASIHFEYIW